MRKILSYAWVWGTSGGPSDRDLMPCGEVSLGRGSFPYRGHIWASVTTGYWVLNLVKWNKLLYLYAFDLSSDLRRKLIDGSFHHVHTCDIKCGLIKIMFINHQKYIEKYVYNIYSQNDI